MALSHRLRIDISYAVALLALALAALISYRSIRELQADQGRVAQAEEVIQQVSDLASHLTDAETAQRGFLLTRQERFLRPYAEGLALVDTSLARLRALQSEPIDAEHYRQLELLVRRRVAHMDSVVRMARAGRFEEAVAVVLEGAGIALMEQVRGEVRTIEATEIAAVQARQREVAQTTRRTIAVVLLASVLAVLVVAASRHRLVAELLERERAERSLAQSARSTRTLYDVVSSRTTDFDEKVMALLRMGGERFGLSNGVLARVEGDEYHIMAAVDPTGGLRPGDVFPLADTYCAAVLRDQDARAVERASASEFAAQPCYARFGLETYIGAPVIVNGQPFGALCFSDPQARDRPFSAEETDFLRLMAHWIGGELERREAEQATRESEQRYRRLTEASLEGIVLSQEGRIVDANLAFSERFGASLDELVGRQLLDFVAPESREQVLQNMRSGYSEPYEIVALYADGSRFYVEVRGRTTTHQGRPARVTAVHDITERKHAEVVVRESEERFRSLVETASDIIYRTDLEGRFTYVNPMSVQIMGYPEERLLGMHYSELVREDAREAAAAFYGAQVAEGRPTTYYEFPAVTGDGREVWIGQNLTFLYEGGEVVGFQAVARDITRQREVERLKDEFLSVVSHELRTPLTAIRGSLGLLASGKMGTLEERGQRMLEIAAQNTDRLVRLINDLLDIERIESGRTSMEVQAVRAGELQKRSAEAMSAVAEKARVRLVVEPFEAVVSADPDRLEQVLTNLLSNAIKFSPEGGTVTAGGEIRGGEAVFWVKDEGRGIPADMLESIFDRFQQVDSSDARQKGGTGLGLPIARSIIQQHGGRIWVQSQWGVGSTFFFSLPAVDAERRAGPDDRPLVMVVEDDPGVAALVHAFLERDDFRARAVTSGEEALRVVGELQPAVILLDLGLPGMSGREVLRGLRQRSDTRRIPVVVLTGAGEDTGLELAEIIGWVEKPIDRESLITTIRWAVAPKQEHYHLLLVEDNADLARVITETLQERGLKIIHAATGREAIDLSRRISYDLLLLDPGLPDVDGYGVVDWLRRHNRHRNVPLVVYSARELSDSERDRLRLGPTEFIVKARSAPEELEERVVARLNEMMAAGQALRA